MFFLITPTKTLEVRRTPNQSVGQPQQQQRQTKTSFSNRDDDDESAQERVLVTFLSEMGTTKGQQTEDERIKTRKQQGRINTLSWRQAEMISEHGNLPSRKHDYVVSLNSLPTLKNQIETYFKRNYGYP